MKKSSRTTRDPDHRDALVDLPRHGAAADALDERERDVAAVQRQQRQQVQEREREADQPEHPEVRVRPLLDRLRGALDDPDRAGDVSPRRR